MQVTVSGRQPETAIDGEQPHADYIRRIGTIAAELRSCAPDFLVISASKTGTTWLSRNLSLHPDIYIPAIKEVHYFNRYWKRLDLNWYLAHFRGHQHQKKGDATPYAGLPLYVIKIIAQTFPRLKLIFLMREPRARAWSHAKHDFALRYGVFRDTGGDFASIPEQQFIEHFADFHAINIGDYQLCLSRWLSCFDRQRIFIGFYESIETAPRELLRSIFDHLGVDGGIDLASFPVFEKILPGIELALPPRLKSCLDAIYVDKTKQLSAFLKERTGLETPQAWADILTADDPGPLVMNEDYNGYAILLHRGKFYAVTGAQRAEGMSNPNELVKCAEQGECFAGHSIDEVRYYVDHRVVEPDREQYAVRCHLASVNALLSTEVAFIEHYLGFDIFLFEGRFHAVENRAGDEAARRPDGDFFRHRMSGGEYVAAANVEEARRHIESSMPALVLEGFHEYNIVLFGKKYYALAQRLGPVDFTRFDAQKLCELENSGHAAVADSFEQAQARVIQLTAPRNRHG